MALLAIDGAGATPSELADRMAAERAGSPYLLYRNSDGRQRIGVLAGRERVSIGRSPECDLVLHWDRRVSGAHTVLVRIGDDWTLTDDNLSRNGTFVDGERVVGTLRLSDGDLVRCGDTVLVYRSPGEPLAETLDGGMEIDAIALSDAQRRVLLALCRPAAHGGPLAGPATNRQIASEVSLTVAGVKTHLRALFGAFGIGDLPRAAKRAELARRALATGAVARADLLR